MVLNIQGAVDAASRRYVFYEAAKNDTADAEAICEAGNPPSMRLLRLGDLRTWVTLVLHRAADADASACSCRTRSVTWQSTGSTPAGRNGLQRLITILGNADDDRVPAVARASLAQLVCQFRLLNDLVPRTTGASGRAPGSAGIGLLPDGSARRWPMLASAMVATCRTLQRSQPAGICCLIGLVPRQNPAAAREKLGGITKQGDRYLRQLLERPGPSPSSAPRGMEQRGRGW